MQEILKSNKLANVFYDLRGPVLQAAKRLEEEGHPSRKGFLGGGLLASNTSNKKRVMLR